MNVLKKFIMILIIPIISACSVFGMNQEKEAQYSLILEDNNFEIREYNNLALATTEVKDKEKARNSNFRKLFNYISGENEAEEKISMTTPVIMEENNEMQTMSFVLPKKYSLNNAPKPKNSNVVIETYTNKKFAILKWKGGYNEKKLSEYKVKLKTFANSKNYKTNNNFKLASFNPPWTIPMFRKYELMLEIN